MAFSCVAELVLQRYGNAKRERLCNDHIQFAAKPRCATILWLNELWALVGQAFSLPDFFHRLLD